MQTEQEFIIVTQITSLCLKKYIICMYTAITIILILDYSKTLTSYV